MTGVLFDLFFCLFNSVKLRVLCLLDDWCIQSIIIIVTFLNTPFSSSSHDGRIVYSDQLMVYCKIFENMDRFGHFQGIYEL